LIDGSRTVADFAVRFFDSLFEDIDRQTMGAAADVMWHADIMSSCNARQNPIHLSTKPSILSASLRLESTRIYYVYFFSITCGFVFR